MTNGIISSPLKCKYKDKEEQVQNKPQYLYFDLIIDEDKTKITVLVPRIEHMIDFKQKRVEAGTEIFIEGKLDFQNEIKSHKMSFEKTDVMMQLKVYTPVIIVKSYKLIKIVNNDIIPLAESIY